MTGGKSRIRPGVPGSGFTLLEVLLATTLLSILLWVLYDAYVSSSRIVARCQRGFAPVREGLKVQRILSRTLSSASAAKQRNTKAIFTGEESRLALTTLNRQGYDPDRPSRLAYVRLSHDADEGLKILTHPTYFLTDKEDATKGTTVRFAMVRKLRFRYWDGSDWIREWEATKKGKLPTRVKVEITLEGEDSGPIPWSFDAMLPIQSDVPITGGPAPVMPGRPGAPGMPGVPGMGGGPAQPFPGPNLQPLPPAGGQGLAPLEADPPWGVDHGA